MSGFDAINQQQPPKTRRFQFTWVGLLGIIGALVFFFVVFQQYRLFAKTRAEPTVMKLADLMTNGPGDNLYLELQDVYLLDQPAVVRSPGEWAPVWIDATPSGVDGARGAKPPGARNVVVMFDDLSSETEYQQRCVDFTHTGMIMNDIRKLDDETVGLMAQQVPDFDPESAFIFQVGSSPPTRRMLLLYTGLGLVCLIVAGFGFFPKS